MQSKRWPKILLIIFTIALLGSSFYVYKKFWPKAKETVKKETLYPGTLLGPKTPDYAPNLDPEKVIEITNQYRIENKLGKLTKNNTLTKAAVNKVDDMFQNQYFEHISPSGTSPSELVAKAGYNYSTTGENLALGNFKSEKELVDAWMASPGHRANILNSTYTEIGVATGLDEYPERGKTWLAVQEFGKPMPVCTKPSQSQLDSINTNKTTYEALVKEVQKLYADASNLAFQANEKIKQGNEAWANGDKKTAQTLWKEGDNLRKQSDAKNAEGDVKKAQAEALYSTIETDLNNYNSQVNAYNSCIKQ